MEKENFMLTTDNIILKREQKDKTNTIVTSVVE